MRKHLHEYIPHKYVASKENAETRFFISDSRSYIDLTSTARHSMECPEHIKIS
jgi:hypothetical protein